MPVSVNAALRESLAGSEPGHNHHHHHGAHQLLQSQMASTTKHLVLKNIEYEEYPENFLAQNDALKSKYILLSSTQSDKGANGCPVLGKKALISPSNGNSSNGLDSNGTTNGTTPKKDNKNELPLPKRILFPRDKIRVGWKGSERKWQVGAGFVNVGNTCYLNSTLQALLHVPAMATWLASDTEHRESWSGGGDMVCCTICAVAQTLLMSQKASHAVKPYMVYSRLRSICKHMAVGRQEDAHEFLRYLIDAMEKAYLERFNKGLLANLDQYSKETTPLNQILGFYLRSSVRCLSCNHVSITFQHFEDLLLDIRKSNTVDEALQGYFAKETLEDMDYTCSGCKKKVSATKQFSIERPPIVLCIQLKRFSIQGNKLNKQVSIRPKLDLTPYVRKVGQQGQQPLTYRLVSLVTHLGSSQHCGHYTAIGLTESGAYYQFDDSMVHPIALQNVLQTNAYIMFYELESSALQRTTSNGNGTAAASPTATVTAKTNGILKQQVNGVSGTKAGVTNGHGASTPPHVNGNGNFIGPVLPPNHPSANNKEQRSLQNGHASPVKKDSAVVTNGGGFGASVLKLNKTPTEAAGSAVVKKYPSADQLFKSPAKEGESSMNGRSSPAKRESTSAVQQISPKSLVPYNSNLSSDEDEEEDDDDKELDTSKEKKATTPLKNGNGQSYVVHSNNGVWKVQDEPTASPPTKKGPWKSNGNGKAALNELLKMDHNAYGGVAVSTWSGEKSNMEKEASDEKILKRSFMDRKADDDEMDRGHVKKPKTNNNVGRDNPGFNPFQEAENKNNQLQQQGLSNGNYRPHFNGGNRHHHNNNHHSNGQSRTDWVNNGRPSGMGGFNKFKWNGGGGGHNNRPQNHNRNWGKFNYKKHGHQRQKGHFNGSGGGGGGGRNRHQNRPNH